MLRCFGLELTFQRLISNFIQTEFLRSHHIATNIHSRIYLIVHNIDKEILLDKKPKLNIVFMNW